jgi:uracil-DNA glycosylase
VTLGRFSMNKFFPGAKISTVHGQMQKIGERFVIPMFHPAAALHQAALKPSILGDFAKLPDQLNEARVAMGKPAIVAKRKLEEIPNEKPQQMSLF